MPGFNRPDFPEVPDSKINIGDHRDGMPLRVTDLYQEIGSLSNEPVLHDQILTPSIVPETMEQKIANAINDFLSTGLKKSKKQTVIKEFAAFIKDRVGVQGDVKGKRRNNVNNKQLIKAIDRYLKNNDEEMMELCKCGKKRGHKKENFDKACNPPDAGAGAAID